MRDYLLEIKPIIGKATEDGDFIKTGQLSKLAQTFQEIEKARANINAQTVEAERQLEILKGPTPGQNSWIGRRGTVRVTPGALEHSYLLVTPMVSDKTLSRSETLEMYVPATQERFKTEVYWRNKNLKARDPIKRFYHAAGIKAGDWVKLEEVSQGSWVLTKCAPPGGAI